MEKFPCHYDKSDRVTKTCMDCINIYRCHVCGKQLCSYNDLAGHIIDGRYSFKGDIFCVGCFTPPFQNQPKTFHTAF